MANFYYGSDSDQNYWVNLDHVSFVNPEENRLILKMLGNFAVVVEGEDMSNLKQVLWNQTLNREKSELGEYDNSLSTDDDNYEYVPTK
jgi:hypothetical protein